MTDNYEQLKSDLAGQTKLSNDLARQLTESNAKISDMQMAAKAKANKAKKK